MLPRSSLLFDRVLMLSSQQAHDIARAINDHSKQARDIAAQHAHVERFQLSHGGVPTPKYDLPAVLTYEPNLGFHENRVHHATQASEAI
jgi:hypothetical protein